MGLANRFLQHVFGGVAFISVGKLHIEVDVDVSDVIAVRTSRRVAVAAQLKTRGLRPLDSDGVDIHGCASGDGHEQQLNRCEFSSPLPAERQRASAGICGLEVVLAQPREIDRGHAPTLPERGELG